MRRNLDKSISVLTACLTVVIFSIFSLYVFLSFIIFVLSTFPFPISATSNDYTPALFTHPAISFVPVSLVNGKLLGARLSLITLDGRVWTARF
jgi:hypothetical protein